MCPWPRAIDEIAGLLILVKSWCLRVGASSECRATGARPTSIVRLKPDLLDRQAEA
jgi:hypothetical protein